MRSSRANLSSTTLFTPNASGGLVAEPPHEGVAPAHRVPRAAAQSGVAAWCARAGGHGRKVVARLRAEVSRDAGRCGRDHWAFRRAPNLARRALCLSGRLADRSLGPAAILDALQRVVLG